MAYINPKWIIVEFLRRRITDPRSRIVSGSDTFSAPTVSQTDFELDPETGYKLSCTNSFLVNVTTYKYLWRDYWIDWENNKLILFTGLTAGEAVDPVTIAYKKATGSDWIFPDKPDENLSATSFPRISVSIPAMVGSRLGQYNAPTESVIRFQVDIWCKEKQNNQIFTISGRKYTGEKLAGYLGYKILEAFNEYEDDFFPIMYGFNNFSMMDMPFDIETQTHHKIIEFDMRMVNIADYP
jgi:hypothetical protein